MKTHLDYAIFAFAMTLLAAGAAAFFWRRHRIRLVTPAFVVLWGAILTFGVFWVDRQDRDVRHWQQKRLLDFAPTYALELEYMGHARLQLSPALSDDPLYLAMIERQKAWLKANPSVVDIYTCRRSSDGRIVFVVDSETDYDRDGIFEGDRERRTVPGEVFSNARAEIESAFLGQPSVTREFYTDRWGTWLTAFVPMRDRHGVIEAVVGVDYPAELLMEEVAKVRRAYIGYLAALLLLILIYSCAFRRVQFELHEKAKAQAELERSRVAQLRGAKLSALGEMSAGLAHEINNPLSIILGKIGLIRARFASQERTAEALANPDAVQALVADLEKIEATANRIAKIVRGLRSFARSAEHDPPQPVAVEQVVTDSVELCAERFRFAGIELRIEYALSGDAAVLARGPQLSQVLVNLLNNAYDAVANLSEKWVLLRAEAVGERMNLSVTDSARGIPEAVREKIMMPFFTTKEAGQGTGLGLSISKGLVEDNGGTLRYDADARNTRFVVDLPMYRGDV